MPNGSELWSGGRLFRTRWLPVLAYVALIFTLSAQPHLVIPGTYEYRDKLAHLLEYGGLGWLVQRAARDTWPTAGRVRRLVLGMAAASALGAADEKFQAIIPGRESSVYDWLADTTGATLVQLVVLAREKRRGVA